MFHDTLVPLSWHRASDCTSVTQPVDLATPVSGLGEATVAATLQLSIDIAVEKITSPSAVLTYEGTPQLLAVLLNAGVTSESGLEMLAKALKKLESLEEALAGLGKLKAYPG